MCANSRIDDKKTNWIRQQIKANKKNLLVKLNANLIPFERSNIIKTSKKGPFSTSTLKASYAFKEIGIDINLIPCGGKNPTMQEREQWLNINYL